MNYNNSNIDIVKDFNYLGVYFSRTGSFKTGKLHLAEKATNAMYDVLRKGRKHNLSISCQLDLFDKLVKPILLYGCEIWGYENIDILEKVHLKFCKLLLHLKPTTPNYVIYGELGRYPLNIDIKIRMISYWIRILKGKQEKLCFIVFKLLLKLENDSTLRSSWLNYISNIFNECGLSYIWSYQNFYNYDWLKHTIRTSLQDQFIQTWSSNINNSPKTVNYCIYKESFAFENYINKLDDKDVFTLCRFRTVNHKLPIESGRWKNIPRENRTCNLCNSNEIGDEFHYILECTYFSEERKECIDEKFCTNINTLKFKAVMNFSKQSKLKKLCTLISIINTKIDSL